jgi:hypothetical protein
MDGMTMFPFEKLSGELQLLVRHPKAMAVLG